MTLILALGVMLSASARAEGAWLTSWDEAVKESKKTGKPILMDFTGSDWCGWCIKLKKEVFDQPEFAAWAKKKVVLLEVDFPNNKPQSAAVKKQNEELQTRYQIDGYPTILFVDASGKVLGKYGYDEGGPAKWTANADKMLKK
jgi:protein disulfide-isomerase